MVVGDYDTDLIVDCSVAVEIKVNPQYDKRDEAQLLNELKATGLTHKFANIAADSGAWTAGLRMTALPAARAGPTLWVTVLSGELNGVMATTGPTGRNMV